MNIVASSAGFSSTQPSARFAPRSRTAEMRQLVERAQAGDAASFGQIYVYYKDMIATFIYARVKHVALTQDLTQDTFLRAIMHLGSFTWRDRDFGAWLITIARHIIIDYSRSQYFRRMMAPGWFIIDHDDTLTSPDDVEEIAIAQLESERLYAAITRLNERQQECIRLRYLQGLSLEEVAAAMSTTVGAAKLMCFRAIRSLKRFLIEELSGD